MREMMVDLPQPLGPTKATDLPTGMVIASEEWKGGEIDEFILTYDEIQLHRCVCGEWLEHV